MALRINSTKHSKTNSFQSFLKFYKSRKRGNSSKLILWGQHHLDIKTRQKYFKKIKSQETIPFTTALKQIRYLRINLIKEIRVVHLKL